MAADVLACAELGCHFLKAGDLAGCEKERHCPFAHQRRREEDVIDQEAKDAARKAEG